MKVDTLTKIPCRVTVSVLVSSRYSDGERSSVWDDRVDGFDIIKTSDNKHIKLWSDGQQSPPKPGWVILIEGGDAESGYRWTLYGIPHIRRSTSNNFLSLNLGPII